MFTQRVDERKDDLERIVHYKWVDVVHNVLRRIMELELAFYPGLALDEVYLLALSVQWLGLA